MARVFLVHWNALEALDRRARLEKAGHDVETHSDPVDPLRLRSLRDAPPDVVVIDLGRLPSHGRDVAVWLRNAKSTRGVPIVFIEGDAAKTRAVERLLPDAHFTDWRRVRGTITRALKSVPKDPIVPKPLEGYSGTPLPRKLGVKARLTLMLLGAPEDFEATLGALPEDVTVRRQARGRADVSILFVRSVADLERRFETAVRALEERGRLWIAWPKKASGFETDITQTRVREHGLDRGLVDFKICAIDATWSGLCFVRRS